MKEVAASIVIAALIVGGDLWVVRPGNGPRYVLVADAAAMGVVYRLDTQTGEVIQCAKECTVRTKADSNLTDLDRDLRNNFE